MDTLAYLSRARPWHYISVFSSVIGALFFLANIYPGLAIDVADNHTAINSRYANDHQPSAQPSNIELDVQRLRLKPGNTSILHNSANRNSGDGALTKKQNVKSRKPMRTPMTSGESLKAGKPAANRPNYGASRYLRSFHVDYTGPNTHPPKNN